MAFALNCSTRSSAPYGRRTLTGSSRHDTVLGGTFWGDLNVSLRASGSQLGLYLTCFVIVVRSSSVTDRLRHWRPVRPWRVGLFDFGSGSGRVWPKSSGFGFGFGYCAYYGLKANSLVILWNFILCKGTELTNECYVIQIMLGKNWNIMTT